MSEIKRPALISISSHKVDDKNVKEIGKSVRICLVLPESNEDTCPEFNYKEELAAAKKKDKVKHVAPPTSNGLDPFNDNDDDVRRIVQEMEAKYGVASPKKRRKNRKDDYADIGMGYDESDSFIDNTDGYDEMIPQNVTALLGGFYINSGALEFKTDDVASSESSSSSSSSDEDDVPMDGAPKSKSRKRIFSSDSEGDKETENEEFVEKKRKFHTNGDVPKIIKKKLFTPEKIKHMKKKRIEEKLIKAETELLKEKKDTNQVVIAEKIVEKTEKEESKDSMKENKKPVPMDNISDIIESVVRGVDDHLIKLTNDVKQETLMVIQSDDSSRDGSEKLEELVKLPENLPNDIVDIIEHIKALASKSTEGKVKFFAGPVSETLLRLERKCKCLGRQSRLKIYGHLAPFVRCRKETLMKRAKNLMFEDEERRLKALTNRLKGDIENVMPALLENYERESQRALQRKFSKESITNEENKQIRMPKRRFSWTEDTRKLLREIVALRKKCFILEGKNKDNLELLMHSFLKTDLQILWPEGWMSMNALLKVCSGVLTPDVKNSSTPSSNGQKFPLNVEMHSSREIQKLTSNSNLSITPVLPNAAKPLAADEIKSKSLKSDITINKIESADISTVKISKALPEVVKTPNSLTITPTPPAKLSMDKMERIDFIKPKVEKDLIIIEDTPPQAPTSTKLDFSKLEPVVVKDNCQIIDLTDHMNSETKKKISKSKYYDPSSIKEELVVNATADSLLSNPQKIPQNVFKSIPIEAGGKYCNSNYNMPDYGKIKSTEGDDIQKVMENLKVLQKLSSPVKSNDSAVSVIAYNKSYSPKGMSSHASSLPSPHTSTSVKADFDNKTNFSNTSFQEAFQQKLYSDFNLLQNTTHATPSSKSSYNSSDKYVHSSTGYKNDNNYYQTTNNNFGPQNSTKIKNISQQQAGTCNILDDMLANFLTEYGYPKTAGHLPKQSQK